MPTILLKKSDTPGSVPGTANLTNLAGGVEVAVNTADKRMFSMTSASAVIELGTNPSSLTCADASFTVARVGSLTISSLSLTNATFASATITNLTSTSATITNLINSGGTANGVLYLNGSKVATSGSALTFDGTNFSSTGTATVNSGNSSSVGLVVKGETGNGIRQRFIGQAASGQYNWQIGASITAAGEFSFMPSTAADGTTFTSSVYNITPTGVSYWSVGGSEAMRLTSTGLGIGTSSPAFKLQVTGTQRIEKSGAGYEASMLSFSTLSETGAIYRMGMASGGAFIIGRSDTATTNLTLDSSGNLGIGTSSPAVPLDVVSNSGSNGINIRARSSNDYGFLNFKSNDGSDTAGSIAALRAGVNSGSLLFYTGTTEKARLDTSGNLGIGTSSPAGSLHVSKSGYAIFDNSAYAQTPGTTGLSIGYNRSGGSGESSIIWSAPAAGFNFEICSFASSTITPRLTIDSSGNLGLGVTPTNNTLGKALQVGQAGAWVAESGSNRWWLASNWYYNSGDKYINNGHATLYSQQSGQHQWLTAASGTAGNAISFTQAATLDANGNFMVGLTSSTHRLQAEVASGADRDIFMASVAGASNGFRVQWVNSTSKIHVNIQNLPTSSAGLPAGTLWNDSGTLKVA